MKYITVDRPPTISISTEQAEEALGKIRNFLDETGATDIFGNIEILDAGKRLELRTNNTWYDISRSYKKELIATLGNMYYLFLCRKGNNPCL